MNGTVTIPAYSKFNASAGFGAGSPIVNSDGLFLYDPQAYTGLLLESGRLASNRNGPNGTSAHVKLDNTGFLYHGRSYGAGSAVGYHNVTSASSPLWYQYTELGIVAQASCERNESSAFRIVDTPTIHVDGVSWQLTVGHTDGSFADGSRVHEHIWVSGVVRKDLFAMSQLWQPQRRQTLISIAVDRPEGNNHKPAEMRVIIARFGKYQCRLSFKAHEILTKINVTDSTIEAVPTSKQVKWPVWPDKVVQTAGVAFISLSRSDNGFGGSRLGTAMALNALTYGNISTRDLNTVVPEEVIAGSLTDFVTSVFDNILVLINANRIQRSNDTAEVPATLTVHRVAIGEAGFIYAIFAVNWLVVLLCVGYVLFTRAWLRTAYLDFTDLAAVVLSTSKGGSALFELQGEKSDPASIRFRLDTARWPAIVSAHKRRSREELLRGATPRRQLLPARRSYV